MQMSSLSEIDAMKAIEDALKGFDDEATKKRILNWAWAKFLPAVQQPNQEESKQILKIKKNKKGKPTAKTSPSIIKELNLKPKGKKSFVDFANEKQPSLHPEQCAVAVYYLQHELEIPKIGVNHVFTCYKAIGWRLPADFINKLQWIASQKGWIDTSNMEEIKITTHGTNLVEQDLPKKGKK
jgi:hypothetical protein